MPRSEGIPHRSYNSVIRSVKRADLRLRGDTFFSSTQEEVHFAWEKKSASFIVSLENYLVISLIVPKTIFLHSENVCLKSPQILNSPCLTVAIKFPFVYFYRVTSSWIRGDNGCWRITVRSVYNSPNLILSVYENGVDAETYQLVITPPSRKTSSNCIDGKWVWLCVEVPCTAFQ